MRENVLFQLVLEVTLLLMPLIVDLSLQDCPLLFEVPYQIHHLQLSKSYSTN